MPSKIDKISIDDAFLKKSAKLLPCQKEMIVYWNNRGISQRKLALMFNVSRRLIQFILDPSKHQANLEARKQRGGSKIYYKREKHTKSVKEHRKYKQSLCKI
jgi:transposase